MSDPNAASKSRARRLLVIALALGALATATVLRNQRAVGVPRDEVVYMHAGARYADWWTGLFTGQTKLDQESITAHFGGKASTDNNREHPPLMKTLSGLSERALHDRLGWVGELTAYRLPAAIFHGALIALIALFAGGIWGTAAGALAALLMLLIPRPLFHAGLACFDGPIATLWFATIVAYHRALVTGRRAWLAGVCFGLALATKHNALLLPFAITAHYALTAWLRPAPATATKRRRLAAALRALWQLRPGALLAMALVGPLVLFALWPWLWLSPVRHVAQWIAFHTHHVHYNFEYLGHNWNAPPFPWHVPLVTTWLTVPVITLVASLVGARVMASRPLGHGADDKPASGATDDALAYRPGLLLLLSLAASAGPFFLRSTPIFGAEKHWEPAIPTLCIAAGVGLVAAARGAARWMARRWPGVALFASRRFSHALVALVGGVALLSAAIETFHPQPYGLTAYNALAGGAPGAADLGMNRQFWGIAAREVLPEIAKAAPPPGAPPVPVYTHDAAPAWGVYRHLGLLPAGLPDAGGEGPGIARSQLAIVIHERHFARHDFMIWQSYGTVQPIFVLRLDGVPLVSLYRRPRPPASPR
jgi:Dolichyl-phosphate-mannose-protein mannosyltransferase